MKHFYDLPTTVQWAIALVLLFIGLVAFIPILANPFGLFLLPLLAPIFNFISVPIFRLTGYFKYLNPYVLSTIQTNKKYDLHNVFTFDYLVHFKWSHRGKYAQRILLGHYFKALLVIIERIETGNLSPEVKIVGNSYFFNDRTTGKLGFTLRKASFFWIFNSIVQCIELTYLYSFSQGKWAIPKFWKVQRAEITGGDLVKKKVLLEALVLKILPHEEVGNKFE